MEMHVPMIKSTHKEKETPKLTINKKFSFLFQKLNSNCYLLYLKLIRSQGNMSTLFINIILFVDEIMIFFNRIW